MAGNYTETTDSSGLTVVELNDHSPWVFGVAILIGGAPMFEWGFSLKTFLLSIVVLLVTVAYYVFSRKTVRIVVDNARRVLRLGKRAIPLTQILRAELSAVEGERESPSSHAPVYYRVDLVLRSGERIQTTSGHGEFAAEDCHRLMDLINTAASRS